MVSNVGYMGTPPVINSVSARNIKKPALDRIIVSVKDERMINYPRYHLVSQFALCALRNTCIFPATDVCLTSQDTQLTL